MPVGLVLGGAQAQEELQSTYTLPERSSRARHLQPCFREGSLRQRQLLG